MVRDFFSVFTFKLLKLRQLGIISFITVNVTVLQCNWLQNTENNLLIQVDLQ